MLHISEHPAERLLIREGRLFDARGKANIQIGKVCQGKNAFVSNLSRSKRNLGQNKHNYLILNSKARRIFTFLMILQHGRASKSARA